MYLILKFSIWYFIVDRYRDSVVYILDNRSKSWETNWNERGALIKPFNYSLLQPTLHYTLFVLYKVVWIFHSSSVIHLSFINRFLSFFVFTSVSSCRRLLLPSVKQWRKALDWRKMKTFLYFLSLLSTFKSLLLK